MVTQNKKPSFEGFIVGLGKKLWPTRKPVANSL